MDRSDIAIKRIKAAAEVANEMGNNLIVAYSGGKDSEVLLDLALRSDVEFKVEHNHTTVDAPETVWHIKEVFHGLSNKGITTKINYPDEITDVDGRTVRASMWNLIPVKRMPPTRIARYCCEFFKERRFDGQHIMTGVRWAESNKRKNRGAWESLHKDKQKRIIYYDENDDAQKLTDICQLRARIATNPIIDWTDGEIWRYIKDRKLQTNPLYACGFSRIGCIGCPMAGRKGIIFEFEMYPQYRKNYVSAFDRMLAARKRDGLMSDKKWANGGESVMDWWLSPSKKKATNGNRNTEDEYIQLELEKMEVLDRGD